MNSNRAVILRIRGECPHNCRDDDEEEEQDCRHTNVYTSLGLGFKDYG